MVPARSVITTEEGLCSTALSSWVIFSVACLRSVMSLREPITFTTLPPGSVSALTLTEQKTILPSLSRSLISKSDSSPLLNSCPRKSSFILSSTTSFDMDCPISSSRSYLENLDTEGLTSSRVVSGAISKYTSWMFWKMVRCFSSLARRLRSAFFFSVMSRAVKMTPSLGLETFKGTDLNCTSMISPSFRFQRVSMKPLPLLLFSWYRVSPILLYS